MRYRFLGLWVAAVIAVGIGGCGGGGTSADPLGTDSLMFGHKNDSAGTDWSMSMQTAATGTVVLTGKVKNAYGNAVAGRAVSFGFVANPSGAKLNNAASAVVNTDAAGEAVVIYTAGTVTGFDVVRASISNGAQMDVNITVGSPSGTGGRQISLAGSPTSLAAGRNSVLAATVTDGSGNPVSGAVVSFSYISNLSGAPLLSVLNGGLTDGGGRAMAVYTAGSATPNSEVQDAVKAELTGVCAAAIVLTRTAATTPATTKIMTLNAGTPTLAAGQNSIVTARVTDTTGSPLGGQAVTFQFRGGGAAPSGGSVGALNGGITDGNGQALAVYTAGNNTPTVGVQDVVEAGITGASGAVVITRTASAVVPPVGYRMALAADVTSLAAGRSAVVTATVTDGSGNPAGGQAVTFALLSNNSGATLVALNGGNTDSSGRAVAVYTAGAASPTAIVQDTIQAGVTGSAGAVVMTRTAAGGGAGTGVRMTVTATPTSLAAGALSVIIAQVNNADGTAATGLAVTFSIVTNNSGAPALAPLNGGVTDASGTAVATYTAGNNSPGLSIQDAVSASVTGSAGAAIITRLPATGTGNRISLTLTPPTLPTTTGNCIVTATVLRDDGVTPVANETVTFSIVTGGGAIAPPLTVPTNNSGMANAVFTAPGGATGFEAVVRAEILGTTNGGDAVGIISW